MSSNQALFRWIIEISETSGRLLRCRMCFRETEFDAEYKKSLLNTRTDALGSLRLLGETAVPVNADILHIRSISPRPRMTLKASSNSMYSLHRPLIPLGNLFLLFPTNYNWNRVSMSFFCTIGARICEGKSVPFAHNNENMLLCSTDEFKQIVIFQSFVACVIRLSHHTEVAGYTGRRRLYQFLHRSFFWPKHVTQLLPGCMKLCQLRK